MPQPKPQTAKQRQQALRERNRERGLKLLQSWIHPEDEAAVKRYIDTCNRRRGV